MTCREARSRLSDELNRSLSAAARSELAEHLAACSGCREERRLLGATRQLLSNYGASQCPVDFTYLAAKLPALRERRGRLLSLRYGLTAAAAAVALTAAGRFWPHPGAETLSPPPASRRV